MALVDTAQVEIQHERTDWRPRLALGLAALSATSYLIVLVVPYYAAGSPDPGSFHQYDIGAQWPYTSVLSPLVGLLAFWALGVAPFACAGVTAWSAHRLWTTRAVRGGRAVVWAALLVSVATVAWFVVQGAALLVWLID